MCSFSGSLVAPSVLGLCSPQKVRSSVTTYTPFLFDDFIDVFFFLCFHMAYVFVVATLDYLLQIKFFSCNLVETTDFER